PVYEDIAIKFFEHFALIAAAMERKGLWHEETGFYHDQLRMVDGSCQRGPLVLGRWTPAAHGHRLPLGDGPLGPPGADGEHRPAHPLPSGRHGHPRPRPQ
ncbi:MAG: hypothetical protein LC799_20105, partial [Actinobacteria bacterium]|nr:hypothetical protein [Actinomycetota bacterium]